ncbi:MAG TPA: hypothetical protein VM187_16695, partial [Niastella sp.]|nr:hypothetical protein [Niastella sp.]
RKKTIFLLVVIAGLLSKAEAQKGEKSIAAGIVVALPESRNTIYENGHNYNIGVGLEGIGQYNFTQKSAALLQLQLNRFTGYDYYVTGPNVFAKVHTSAMTLSLKAGYRYQFTPSGFYANVLAGVESGVFDPTAALGVGKRFTVKDIYFLDTGIDYTGGFVRRYNIKAVFSLLRKPKAH